MNGMNSKDENFKQLCLAFGDDEISKKILGALA